MRAIRFGITGKIASGKTYAAEQLKAFAESENKSCQIIHDDDVRRYILYESRELTHILLRQSLAELLNLTLNEPDSLFHDRTLLIQKWFENLVIADKCNALLAPVLIKQIANLIKNEIDIIVIESANFFDNGLSELVGKNILLVKCGADNQLKRLANSDLSASQLKSRIEYQNWLYNDFDKYKQGLNHFWLLDTDNNPHNNIYHKTFNSILHDLAAK